MKNRKFLLKIISIAFLMLSPLMVVALNPESPPTTGPDTPEDLADVIVLVAKWFFTIALIIAVIIFIIGGIQYMTAGGDEEATKKARQKIVYTSIGVAIILLSWLLIRIISGVLGTGTGTMF